MYLLQCVNGNLEPTTKPYIKYPADTKSNTTIVLNQDTSFSYLFTDQLLSSVNNYPNLDELFSTYRAQTASGAHVSTFGRNAQARGDDGKLYSKYNELSTPYVLYNWEVRFHAPMQLADSLLKSQ